MDKRNLVFAILILSSIYGLYSGYRSYKIGKEVTLLEQDDLLFLDQLRKLQKEISALKGLLLEAVSEEDMEILQEANQQGSVCLKVINSIKVNNLDSIRVHSLNEELSKYLKEAEMAVRNFINDKEVDMAAVAKSALILDKLGRYGEEKESHFKSKGANVLTKLLNFSKIHLVLYSIILVLLVSLFVSLRFSLKL